MKLNPVSLPCFWFSCRFSLWFPLDRTHNVDIFTQHAAALANSWHVESTGGKRGYVMALWKSKPNIWFHCEVGQIWTFQRGWLISSWSVWPVGVTRYLVRSDRDAVLTSESWTICCCPSMLQAFLFLNYRKPGLERNMKTCKVFKVGKRRFHYFSLILFTQAVIWLKS